MASLVEQVQEMLDDGDAPNEERNTLNPNETWTSTRGFIPYYLVCVSIVHVVLLSMPVLSTAMAWTLTNVVHAVVTYFLFHHLKGAPFVTFDDDEHARLTQWEQMDHGRHYSNTRKFLIAFPVVLCILAVFYSGHNNSHFWVNFVSSTFTIIVKLPYFHNFRLFGINEY